MKKKIIIAGITVLVLFGAYKVGTYYKSRYVVESVYYAVVPQDQSTKHEKIVGTYNADMGSGKEYKYIGYDETGKSKELIFVVYTKDENKLLQPGQYVKAEVSERIILTTNVVSKEEVPSSVLKLLEDK